MACTFNGLDLESLGTVGDQEVEYASFQTELSSPQGHDGDVLANFRRGPTVVKFNLAMDGTEEERVGKVGALASAMSGGMGELVMPGMPAGHRFLAVPNCVLRPSAYIDGFVVPVEFVVPDGCAWGQVETIEIPVGDGPSDIFIPGDFAPRMRIRGSLHVDQLQGFELYLGELADPPRSQPDDNIMAYLAYAPEYSSFTAHMEVDVDRRSASTVYDVEEGDVPDMSKNLYIQGFPLAPGAHSVFTKPPDGGVGAYHPDTVFLDVEGAFAW